MKVVVIGASGQIGHALLVALREHGHQAMGTYRHYASPDLVHLDASDLSTVRQLFDTTQPDWVFYPAGLSWVDRCEQEPDRCFHENVYVPVQVAGQATQAGAGFVYFSSDYIFDGRTGPYDETAAPNPLNVYGKSKLAAERQLADRIGRLIIVRTTVVYGPESQKKNFVYQLMAKAKGSQKTAVPHDQVTTPTYNLDLAAACVECAERGIIGVINLVGPDRVDRYTFAVKAFHTLNLDPVMLVSRSTSALGQAALRPLNAGLVNQHAAQVLSTPMRGVEEGLQAMRVALASENTPGSRG